MGSRPPTLAVRTTSHGSLAMSPSLIGDPIEDVVVEGEQHAVGRHVHVGLDVAVAEADRALERRHRVLGPLARAAAVGERDRTRMVEERELHH